MTIAKLRAYLIEHVVALQRKGEGRLSEREQGELSMALAVLERLPKRKAR